MVGLPTENLCPGTMNFLKSPRTSYYIASSLLFVAAGVLGYAPVRALLVGASTITAIAAAAAAAAASSSDDRRPVWRPRPGS